ncbi:MAG TPA: serine hydrolase [Sphingobium sp.]|nr:serine hydrolase [Sphingobium sp.]
MFRRWLIVLAGTALLAGPSASQQTPAARYTVLAESPGLSREALRAAIDPLFDTDTEPTAGETRALIIMRRGEVIAERYAPGYGPDSRFSSWSIAKTVTGLLAGIMVSDGRLALDDPAPVPAWHQPGDPRGAITLRHLLQMRSGLRNEEQWRPAIHSDTLDMLVGDGARDQAAFAIGKPLVQTPGDQFAYSSATSMILTGIMTHQLTASRTPQVRRDAMARFIAARFTGPLGLTSFSPEYDESGTLLGAAMMHMNARDYARLGEFIRRRGNLDGRQILSDKWFDLMTAPSPANPAYGMHIWLNRASEQTALFPGEAPPTLMAAGGQRGQYMLISPEQGLVIVRLGVTRDSEMDALRAAMARLVQRFPN